MSVTKTELETEVKVEKKDAKKILFDWATTENENEISDVSKEKLTEFSTAYENEKLKKKKNPY